VDVNGVIYGRSNVVVEGLLEAKSDIDVSGIIYGRSNVVVEGLLEANGNVDVNGVIYGRSNVVVEGLLEANGNVDESGIIYGRSNVVVEGLLEANGNVDVSGIIYGRSNVVVEGLLEAKSDIDVSGIIYGRSNVVVEGLLEANGNVDVSGVINIGGYALYYNNTTSKLTFTGAIDALGGFTENGELIEAGGGGIDYESIGEKNAHFSGVSGIKGGEDNTEFISGNFVYSSNYDIVSKGVEWRIVRYMKDMVVPDPSGNIDTDPSGSIEENNGRDPSIVTAYFIDREGNYIMDDMYLMNKKGNVEMSDMLNVQMYNPIHNSFKVKFVSDWNVYGYDSLKEGKSFTIVQDKVRMPDNYRNYSHNDGSIDYVVMYMGVPSMCTIMSNIPQYLYCMESSLYRRLNGIKKLDSSGQYQDVSGTNIGYPFISLMRWKNTMGESSFRDVIYNEDYDTVIELIDELGWGLELYKRTYLYVKYGSLNYIDDSLLVGDDIWDNIQNYYSSSVLEIKTTENKEIDVKPNPDPPPGRSRSYKLFKYCRVKKDSIAQIFVNEQKIVQ
jgi:phage tail protein X